MLFRSSVQPVEGTVGIGNQLSGCGGNIPYGTDGDHPINSHQTQALLHMPARLCRQDPDIAVSCEAMSVPSKYRSGCSHPSIGQSTGPPMKELEKVAKELKRFAAP